MNREQRRTGSIQKVVRVPDLPLTSEESPPSDFQGYGILRDANGQDVFFVGSAVCDGDFAHLEVGTEVTYVMEPGPLARASQVSIAENKNRVSKQKRDKEFTINWEAESDVPEAPA